MGFEICAELELEHSCARNAEIDPLKPPLQVLWRRDHPRSKAMTQGLRGRLGEKERLRQVGTARS